MKLSGRVALVTGGSSGIGRGIAIDLAREGARVAVADLQEAPRVGKYFDTDLTTTTLEEIEKLGSEGLFLRTDMADAARVGAMVAGAVARFGGLDILVNNAGIYVAGGSQSMPLEDWDRVMAINQRGVFVSCKEAVPHLKRSKAGRIINISSIQALQGGGGSAYPASKAAVCNLTRDLAVELAPDSVTANAVLPGVVGTPMQDYQTSEEIELSLEKTPLPRIGTPRDVGRACVFLASDDAEWITGINLVVDGGWMARIY